MTIYKHSILALSLFLLFSTLIFITPIGISSYHNQSSTSSTPEPIKTTPTSNQADQNIQNLEARVNSLEKFIELESNSYSASVSRMESNTNVILVVMAVASIVVAILGFGVVRLWISKMVEDRVTKITSDQVQNATKAEVDRIRKEWDPKFADLYEEYRKSIPRR
jgi:hypothetical protein